MSYSRKEIMCNAHGKYRQGCYRNFAEALCHAWLEAKIQNDLISSKHKEEKIMYENMDFNDIKLRFAAQKYLDNGECVTIEEAFRKAYDDELCETEYQHWLARQTEYPDYEEDYSNFACTHCTPYGPYKDTFYADAVNGGKQKTGGR